MSDKEIEKLALFVWQVYFSAVQRGPHTVHGTAPVGAESGHPSFLRALHLPAMKRGVGCRTSHATVVTNAYRTLSKWIDLWSTEHTLRSVTRPRQHPPSARPTARRHSQCMATWSPSPGMLHVGAMTGRLASSSRSTSLRGSCSPISRRQAIRPGESLGDDSVFYAS